MRTITTLLILFGFSQTFATIDPQQLKSLHIMQLNNQIIQTENTLNEKIITKKNLKGSLRLIETTLSLSKTLAMKSKVAKLKIDQARVKNDLQQVELDIKQLQITKNNLIKNQKELNK